MRKYPPHCPRPSTNSPIHPRADSTPHPRYRPHTLASSPPSELTPYSLPPSFKVRGDVSVGSLRFSSTSHFFSTPGENLDGKQTFLHFVLLFIITRVRIIFFFFCSRDKVEVNTNENENIRRNSNNNFIDQFRDTRVYSSKFLYPTLSSIEWKKMKIARIRKGYSEEGYPSLRKSFFVKALPPLSDLRTCTHVR